MMKLVYIVQCQKKHNVVNSQFALSVWEDADFHGVATDDRPEVGAPTEVAMVCAEQAAAHLGANSHEADGILPDFANGVMDGDEDWYYSDDEERRARAFRLRAFTSP